MGASWNELLLEAQIKGESHQFLIDSGASLSLVKPGVSQAEVKPTDLAARGDRWDKTERHRDPRHRIQIGESCIYP